MSVSLTKRPQDGPAGDLSGAPQPLIDMAKKAEFALSAEGFADLDIEWIIVADGSWSMGPYYVSRNGSGAGTQSRGILSRLRPAPVVSTAEKPVMELLTDKVTAIAMVSDADQRVPLIPFCSMVHPTIELTPENAEGVVLRELYGHRKAVWPDRESMGGTNLAAALHVAAEMIEKSGRFTIVVVLGDGQPNSPDAATQATIRIGESGGFVKFVSVVPADQIPWLDEVDNLEARRPDIQRDYDNVSSVECTDPANVGALPFFKLITKELGQHIQRATAAGRLS